jgi:hypothetical protein
MGAAAAEGRGKDGGEANGADDGIKNWSLKNDFIEITTDLANDVNLTIPSEIQFGTSTALFSLPFYVFVSLRQALWSSFNVISNDVSGSSFIQIV